MKPAFFRQIGELLNDLWRKYHLYSCVEKSCPTKAYATISKGFMGNGHLHLSDRISRCFSQQKGESMNIRTHFISLYRVKATRTSIRQLTLPIEPFGIGAYAFTDKLSRNSCIHPFPWPQIVSMRATQLAYC